MRREFTSLLKNKQFALLWLDQALSQVSYNLLNFSLWVLVYKLTGSTFAVSVMIVFFYLPALLVSLPAGAICDIFDKRRIMILSDIFWAAAVLLIFVTKGHFWGILFFTFIAKFFDTFFFTSEASTLPSVVSKESLVAANSLFSTTSYASMILGFGLAGPLMRFIGPGAPLVLASALTFGGAVAVSLMKPLKNESVPLARGRGFLFFLTDLRAKVGEGLSFLRLKLIVLAALILSILGQVLAVAIASIVPGYAEKYLRITAEDMSIIVVLPLALGILVGLYFTNHFFKHSLKRVPIRIGLALVSAAFLGLGILPLAKYFAGGPLAFERLLGTSSLAALLALTLGCGASLILLPALTFVQQNTPEHLRGRSFGFLSTITAFLIISLVIPVGGVAELLGAPFMFGFLGVASAIFILGTFRVL
jgi:MFS family permease